MVDLHSSREAGSAQGPPSATERRECKSRVTLLLRDADSGQIDLAAEPTHGPHHPCTSSSRLGARGTLLPIGNLQLDGGSNCNCIFRIISVGVGAVNRLETTHWAAPLLPECFAEAWSMKYGVPYPRGWFDLSVISVDKT